jgi:HCOMODA/2-hydroxy-3-carboxy-muconic semialdehyde decarboxylase
MARSLAPALVTKEEIFEFDENSQPIDPHGKRMYGERFIHGEIYRARPDVQAVVHSHSIAVVPFGTVNVPLRPIMHMAGFLPQQVPVFEIREVKGDDNGILIHDTIAGAALAKVLGSGPVALMRGHGMAVAGPDVRTAVFRAIYTQLDAQVEAQALALGNPKFLNAAEAANVNKVNEEVVIRAWELWAPHAELATAPFRANKP